MTKLTNVQASERFDDDSVDPVIFGFCSNCGKKVYEQMPSSFPEKCPHCNEVIEEIEWVETKIRKR